MTGDEVEPTRIGRYELSSTLGTGGFATVRRAYDTALDGDVAIKILQPQFVDNADIRYRFVQEARLLRRVDSPHLVRVYDVGELDDGRPYFVMELAEGGVLGDRLDRRTGPLDRSVIASVVDALADGLSALHEANIVHRDVKPENLLIAGSRRSNDTLIGGSLLANGERFVIGDLGLAKDHDRTSAGPTVSGGTPFYRAPEQMTPGAPITPAADVYAASGLLWFLLTSSHPPDTASIPAHLPSMPTIWQPVLERGMHRDPVRRHGSIVEWADHAREAIDQTSESGVSTVAVGHASDLCPYKGMAAYQPEDAGLFFGRDDLIDTLVGRLQHHSVIVIGGPSGSGKSSLLRAGLIPRLGRGAIAGSQQWRVALFNPGSDAVGELVHQLRRLGPDTDAGGGSGGDETLRRGDLPHGGRRWLDTGSHTLLAIDQFEELFTLNDSRVEQELFLETLAVMTESTHSRIKVAIALRADFYGACAAFPWLSERINESQLLVGPMSRQELRDAISLPAQRAGLYLEDGLADQMVDDVGGGASGGALPLLGHALMETWIRRRGSQLTIEGYQAAGGVSGAIAQRAEAIFTRLTEAEQCTARELLLQLINPGQGTPDTRRRVRRSTLGTEVAAGGVLEKLAAGRLLTVDNDAVEVAHEALLQSWPRLRQWIDEDREDLQTRRRIGGAAAEWESTGRNPDLLYRGTQLAAALEWVDTNPHQLDPGANEFVVAARDVRDEEEQLRLAGEARSRRVRHLAIGALAALSVAAIASSILALGALRRSQTNERAALAQQVQTLADAAGSSASTEPLLATALALESMTRADPTLATARDALIQARVELDRNREIPQPFGRPVPVGDMLSIVVTPDGERFVTGERTDGGVIFWDRATRRELHRIEGVHTGGIEELAVSPDGRWLMSVGELEAVLWDLAANDPTPIPFYEIDATDKPIWSTAFSPDSATVALAIEGGQILVFDVDTKRLTNEMVADDQYDFLSVSFVDDDRLAAGDGQGNLWLLETTGNPQLDGPTVAGGGNDLWELVVDPEQRRLLAVSNDDTITSWLVETDGLSLESTLSDETIDDPGGAVLTRTGTEVVFGAADGLLYRADPATGQLADGPPAAMLHLSNIIDTSVSANGWLATLGDDQRVQIWRLIGSEAGVAQVIADVDPALDLAVSAAGDRLAVATETAVVILDASSGEEYHRFDGRTESVRFADDTRVVTGSDDGLIRVWDSITGQLLHENAGHDGQPVRAMAVSPDQGLVVTGAADGSLSVWSLDDLTRERTLTPHQSDVTGVAFLPDGDAVVSVGFDKQLRRSPIDGGTAETVAVSKDPLSIAVHPDGELVAYGSGSETVEVIQLDGTAVASMAPNDGGAWDVAFSRDGLTVAASSRGSGQLQLWDWATGEPLGPPFGEVPDDPNSTLQPDVAIGPRSVVWWSDTDGRVHRLDVLDERVGCGVSRNVLNQQLRDRFLDGENLVSCVGN